MWKTTTLFTILSHAMHELWALNLRTSAIVAQDLSAAAGQLMQTRDAAQAVNLLASFGEPATEKMLAYVIRAKEIMTTTKNSLAAITDTPARDADVLPLLEQR